MRNPPSGYAEVFLGRAEVRHFIKSLFLVVMRCGFVRGTLVVMRVRP